MEDNIKLCYICNKPILSTQEYRRVSQDDKKYGTLYRHINKKCISMICERTLKGISSMHPEYKIKEVKDESKPENGTPTVS